MTSEVALGAAMRNNLLSLQKTNSLLEMTQLRLATGRKVNSALDNPLSFFTAQSLTNRSSDLGRLLDSMGQSISTIKEADKGLTSLTKLLEQADATVSQARDALAAGVGDSKLTGSANLSTVSDLTALANVANNDTFTITVGASTAKTITINTGDSGQKLVDEINEAMAGYATASLDSSGKLNLTALKAGDTIQLTAGAIAAANDADFFTDLGLGDFVAAQGNGAGGTVVGGTVVAGNTLKSKAIAGAKGTDTVGSTFMSNLGANTVTFNIAIGSDNISATINNTMTIDQMIAAINADADNKGRVKASFDANSGQIILETSKDVTSLTLSQTPSAAGPVGSFGFANGLSDQQGADTGARAEFITLTGSTELRTLEKNYNELRTQIDALVRDANYRGVNLLGGDTLTTYFNEDRSNKLVTVGQDLTSGGLGMKSADFSSNYKADAADADVRAALAKARDFGSAIANSLAVLQTREDFTKQTMQVLEEGADKLTLADPNEEGARMLALQTRLQLGVTSLSLAAQSQQSVLSLF
jgi:flagellin-like hook-associated protein FlgL